MSEFRLAPFNNGDIDRSSRNFHAQFLNQAVNMFNQARWNSMLEKIKSAVLRRPKTLFDLDLIPKKQIRTQRYAGLRAVSIDRIYGTLGRQSDFDAHFNPLDDRIRDRWVSIAMARCQNIPLKPVELIQVGDCFFVKDGHHRISVARTLGETAIDAEIIMWDLTGALPWEAETAGHPLPQIA